MVGSQTFPEGKGVETCSRSERNAESALWSQTFPEGKGVETWQPLLKTRVRELLERRRPSQKVKVLKLRDVLLGYNTGLNWSQTFPEGKGVETSHFES